MIKRLVKWLRRNEAGQSMVEMALVLPILLILVGGILDFGWLFYNQLALTNAAREGARYAALHYTQASDWEQNSIRVMEAAYVGNIVTDPVIEAQIFDSENAQISASMSANVPILTGIASTVLQRDAMYLTGSCVMRLEN